ncbi:mitochondrial metalloendopeptidase Oma1p [Diutina rugosa]
MLTSGTMMLRQLARTRVTVGSPLRPMRVMSPWATVARSPLGGMAPIRLRHSRYRRFGDNDPDVVEYELDPYGNYRERKGHRYRSSNSWQDLLYDRRLWYLAAGLGLFYVANLHKAPYTGRLQFCWVPYWMEQKMGDMSYRQVMAQFGGDIVDHNNRVYQPIRSVMDRLLKAADQLIKDPKQREHLKKLDWQISVVAGDYPPNAFILPNGKIFIFASIIPICQNEDGLATVLSHELSHQLAHHSSEQLSKSPLYMLAGAIMFSITGSTGLNDLLIQTLFQLPGSRKQESEADHIGCELMAKACFNVDAAVSFWGRMEDMEQQMGGASGGRMTEFFSTHPASEHRIEAIKSWLPQLHQVQEESGCHTKQFGNFANAYNSFF